MNELFNVEVEDSERRKGVAFWLRVKKISGAQALAIGFASLIALLTPVALLASRNNSPQVSAETTVPGGLIETTSTAVEQTTSSSIYEANSQSNNKKKTGLVLPTRGIAPAGTTTTSISVDGVSTTTSTAAPAAPPIVLSPTSTSVATTVPPTTVPQGSVSRTISFTSTAEIVKIYGADSFVVPEAKPSIGGGEVSYLSSNLAVCEVGVSSGEVSITGSGTCVISASISANGIHAAASTTSNVLITINKAHLTITASSASISYQPKRYVVTALYSGFVYRENESVLTKLPRCEVLINDDYGISSLDRNRYATSCSGAEAENYDISYVGGVLSVSDRW